MRCVDYTKCCLYKVDPPDDEQQACSKHVEDHYRNKLIESSASFGSYYTDISQCMVNRTLKKKGLYTLRCSKIPSENYIFATFLTDVSRQAYGLPIYQTSHS